MHGYGIARRIEQVNADEILLDHETIYAALVRLEQCGWIMPSGDNIRQQLQGEVLRHRCCRTDQLYGYWERWKSPTKVLTYE